MQQLGELHSMIRIHFTYRHIDKPWGGANNFIRALYEDVSQCGQFSITQSLEEPCDILFMNQLGTGPGGNGAMVPLDQVRRLLGQKGEGARGKHRKLVVRAVNLNWHAFPLGPRNLTRGWWIDRQTIKLLNMADVAIFQSAYQRDFFSRAGYRGGDNVVIHNGAAPSYWISTVSPPPLEATLRLVSSTAAPRATKRHDLIAKFSMLDNVEVLHLGAWPKGIDTKRVKLLGMQASEQMVKVLSECHCFLHPAIKDPCPNSIFEAVCAGLPVIYNPGPGSSYEILGPCGLALNENDLAQTVAAARQKLPELRRSVLERREYFTIGHAASQYRAVFQRLDASQKEGLQTPNDIVLGGPPE